MFFIFCVSRLENVDGCTVLGLGMTGSMTDSFKAGMKFKLLSCLSRNLGEPLRTDSDLLLGSSFYVNISLYLFWLLLLKAF